MRSACLAAALLSLCALIIYAASAPIHEQREHDRLVGHCIQECISIDFDMGYFEGNAGSWTCTCKNYTWR